VPGDLQPRITRENLAAILGEEERDRGAASPGIDDKVNDFEVKTITDALKACGGNQTKTARLLGITRRTLIYRMKKYGIK
jgi:DNA-binding NtrC family response regulator